MKKTKLFIILIVATMMLFVSCKEKPEPIEEIKTAKDYLANKFIFGLMNIKGISEGFPEDNYHWSLSLIFDENVEAVGSNIWAIEDFENEEKEMKYSVKYNAVKIDRELGEPSGYVLSYDFDIDVVNSTLAKISGTISTFNRDKLLCTIAIDGTSPISDVPKKWFSESTWNISGAILEGSTLLDSYFATRSNCTIPITHEYVANGKYSSGVYSFLTATDSVNAKSQETINIYDPTANDYEFVYETIIASTRIDIDGSVVISKQTTPTIGKRIDNLPLWANDYASLENDEMMIVLPLELDAIEEESLDCAIINNGDESFTYIVYESESNYDDQYRLVTTNYKTYYRVNKTAEGINANCRKVLVESIGKETQIGDSYSMALEATDKMPMTF